MSPDFLAVVEQYGRCVGVVVAFVVLAPVVPFQLDDERHEVLLLVLWGYSCGLASLSLFESLGLSLLSETLRFNVSIAR